MHLETICCESLISTLANFPRSFDKKLGKLLVVYVDNPPRSSGDGCRWDEVYQHDMSMNQNCFQTYVEMRLLCPMQCEQETFWKAAKRRHNQIIMRTRTANCHSNVDGSRSHLLNLWYTGELLRGQIYATLNNLCNICEVLCVQLFSLVFKLQGLPANL